MSTCRRKRSRVAVARVRTCRDAVQRGALLSLNSLECRYRLKAGRRVDDARAVRESRQVAQHEAEAVVERHRNA